MDKTQVIEQAKAHFAQLLSDQLDRAESLENAAAPKDYTKLDKIVVGLCPGDGIGPIIMRETRRVLEKLLADELASGRVVLKDIEGLTIENRMAQGKAIPDDVLAELKNAT